MEPNKMFTLKVERECFHCGYYHEIIQNEETPKFGSCMRCGEELPMRQSWEHNSDEGYSVVEKPGKGFVSLNNEKNKFKQFSTGKNYYQESRALFDFLMSRKYKKEEK